MQGRGGGVGGMREEGGTTRRRSGILEQVPHAALQGPSEGVDRRAGVPDKGGAGAQDGEIRPAPEKAVREDRRRARGNGGRFPVSESKDKISVSGASGKRTDTQGPL